MLTAKQKQSIKEFELVIKERKKSIKKLKANKGLYAHTTPEFKKGLLKDWNYDIKLYKKEISKIKNKK